MEVHQATANSVDLNFELEVLAHTPLGSVPLPSAFLARLAVRYHDAWKQPLACKPGPTHSLGIGFCRCGDTDVWKKSPINLFSAATPRSKVINSQHQGGFRSAVGYLSPDDSHHSPGRKAPISPSKATAGRPGILRGAVPRSACSSRTHTNRNRPQIRCFVVIRKVLGTKQNTA